MQAWIDTAKKLLENNTGNYEEDFHYRVYLRAVISGDQAMMKHMRENFIGSQKAMKDLIANY